MEYSSEIVAIPVDLTGRYTLKGHFRAELSSGYNSYTSPLMDMKFRDGSIYKQAPTHRLVTQTPSEVKDWEQEGIIRVENRAMEVILDYGSTVHVELDPADSLKQSKTS
ncbi:MAG: hypothetical protein J07HQX50_02314 [Haloquadratum sp. J07HQX50]|nr:MAG: hypothetical protein J07HQX50_02314 [Haloquadratum sp. J07HQX50]